MVRLRFILGLLVSASIAFAQNPNLPWRAHWITGPGKAINFWSGVIPDELREYRVLKFKKSFSLSRVPGKFEVNVSADNRYKLSVNGRLVSLGPARSDIFHWNYEIVDLAPYLKTGTNTVAALVWNEGPLKPEAQISLATAFILQGVTAESEVINTNETWSCLEDKSYRPLPARSTGYYVAGPGEWIDMSKTVASWTSEDVTGWQKPRQIIQGLPKGVFTFEPSAWMLVPSTIPQMERTYQRFESVREVRGITVPGSFPKMKTDIRIPAKTQGYLILDQGRLTNAYPTLVISSGKDASLSLTYAEALYIHKDEKIGSNWVPDMPKGNRNEIAGKLLIGRRDSIQSSGAPRQEFTSLWWRTFRYVMIRFETRDEPLIIEDFYSTFTGYPFERKAVFESDQAWHQQNLDIGWHTARLCANETYMDCPYYEQLQYVGDTRIQALVTLYNSGDGRLVRRAIALIDQSRLAEGLTLSRYPTASTQIIPTFSLWWIAMVHDYWRYQPDPDFIRSMLPGVRQVLHAFSGYQGKDQLLSHVPYWTFTDWVEGYGWKDGVAPKDEDGRSSVLDLQLLWAYQIAAELESHLGLKDQASIYQEKALTLKAAIRSQYFDREKGLIADTKTKNYYSQHANSLAILTGVLEDSEYAIACQKLLTDQALAPASIYFKYYLHLALAKGGLAQDYTNWLGKWKENLDYGLTTWAEMSDLTNSRSDCHAWGSSPNIEFFRVFLGINSGAPGFQRVHIEPHLGSSTFARGSIPHHRGTISVLYQMKGEVLNAEVILPSGIPGEFVWKGRTVALSPGINKFSL